MVDWARNSEDKVKVPKNILVTGKPGEKHTISCTYNTGYKNCVLVVHAHKETRLLKVVKLYKV